MVSRAATSVALRPIRSPRCPKIAAPIGRAIKAMAKVASDLSTAAPSLLSGKNKWGKISTAAVA